MSERIQLHYNRPPDRTDLFVQDLVFESDDVLVTYLAATPLKQPLVVADQVVLENGSPAVWFTFPGLKHDIGRFHLPDGTFTGLYANIMEPVTLHSRLEWSATDLFVDVWLGASGEPIVLDRDELEHAVIKGWITPVTALAALAEAEHVVAGWRAGTWPPPVVNEWPITRVRESL